MPKDSRHRRVQPVLIYPEGVKELSPDLHKDELIRRLKVLARSFQDMEQEQEEVSQYEHLALYLVQNFFFKHNNKDVRLLVACCIADIFRVFAPEAPYRTAEQLKVIFQFMNKQLWGLENVDGPSWKRYFYLLENLAMVKSFNICMEIDECNDIFVELFNVFFNIINEHHTPKVRTFMLDVMCPLISEADAVPPDLLEVILANLLMSKKAENPHAFQMAKELIKRTTSSIEPSIQSFFNNVLILGKTSETDLATHSFELIYQLNTISSSLLLSVLPQLEFKLKSNDERERLAVTKLLGRMFSNKDSDLASQNKPLWNCFLGRFSDINVGIRTECVKFVTDFITHHSYLISDLIEKLRERVHDVDEGVRQEVVSAIAGAARKDISNISEEMLTLIKDRTLDKKWKIRKEAVLGLAHIYKKWYNNEELSVTERKRLAWIKDKVLHMYYQTCIEDRLLVERVFTMTLVPYTLEVRPRMQCLLQLFVTVDRFAAKALIEMVKSQHIVRTHVREMMEYYKKDKAERAKLLHPKLVTISKYLPDPAKAVDHLKKLASVLEQDLKVQASMEKVVDPKVTCRRAGQSVGEVMKKFGSPSQPSPLYETIKTLMERIAPLVVDSVAIKELVSIMADHVSGVADDLDVQSEESTIVRGLKLLQTLSIVFPRAFKSDGCLVHLISMLKQEDDTVSDAALQIFISTGENLQEEFPNVASCLLPILISKTKTGAPSQAKHAVRCISSVLGSGRIAVFQQLYDSLQKCLSLDHEHHLTALTAIAEMTTLVPESFCLGMKPMIANSIVKGLLMPDQTSGTPTKGIWCHDNQVAEETLAKIRAMKLLVRWLEGLRNTPDVTPCTSTIRLLMTMIKNDGDLMERKQISKADMSRLRLAAGCAMLKISQVPAYHDLVSLEQFQLLALMINDECYQVRETFARKLNKGLSCLRLPLGYLAIFSLCVKDPVKESKAKAKQYLIANIQTRREYIKQHTVENAHLLTLLPEYVIPFAVHLLAHDPDFTNLKDMEGLRDTKECMWFILEPLITKSENCSFLRKLVENIKQMKDAQKPEDRSFNRKLYAVCDIALGLLFTKTQAFAQKEHPGKLLLPKQLFVKPKKPLLNSENFLPRRMQEEFSQEPQQLDKKKTRPIDKLLESPKGAKGSGKKPQPAEPASSPSSPASPKSPQPRSTAGAENKPGGVSSRRSSRAGTAAAGGGGEERLKGKARTGMTRSRGQALAEKSANSKVEASTSSSESPSPAKRRRIVQRPIKEFLTRSKTASALGSSSPTKSPRKRRLSKEAADSPPAKKARHPSAKSAQAASQAKARTVTASRKLKPPAASPSKSSSDGTPRKNAKPAKTKQTVTTARRAAVITPAKKVYATKKSLKSVSPARKPPSPSPLRRSSNSSPAKRSAETKAGAKKKASPKKAPGSQMTNGLVVSSGTAKRSTLRRNSLNNLSSSLVKPKRFLTTSQQSSGVSPSRYSPRKSVLAGPLTTFQKRRVLPRPSPKSKSSSSSPSSSPSKSPTKSLPASNSRREGVRRKLDDDAADKVGVSSSSSSSPSGAASSPPPTLKKMKQTTLNVNLRNTSRKAAEMNGACTSDDNASSGSGGRTTRHGKALARSVESEESSKSSSETSMLKVSRRSHRSQRRF